MSGDDALRAAAFHEAGHVVAAWAVFRDVEACSVLAGSVHDGRTRYAPPDEPRPSDPHDWSLEDKVDEIVVALAGQLSEEREGEQYAARGGAGYILDDDSGAFWLAPGSDAQHAWDLVTTVTADEDEQSAFLGWLGARTSALLDLYWHTVETVADALLIHCELNEQDLQILRAEHHYPVFRDDAPSG